MSYDSPFDTIRFHSMDFCLEYDLSIPQLYVVLDRFRYYLFMIGSIDDDPRLLEHFSKFLWLLCHLLSKDDPILPLVRKLCFLFKGSPQVPLIEGLHQPVKAEKRESHSDSTQKKKIKK